MGLTKGAVTAQALPQVRDQLLRAGRIEAIDLPGLSDERRPIIAGGVLVLEAAFAALGLERMAVSKAALREGVLHDMVGRSEEHTSELQSLMRISYAVFCLKKKK